MLDYTPIRVPSIRASRFHKFDSSDSALYREKWTHDCRLLRTFPTAKSRFH